MYTPVDFRAALSEACALADTLSNNIVKFPAEGPTMTDRRIAELRVMADAPLTLLEALRDPRVRAGTHMIEFRDPWKRSPALLKDCDPSYGLVRLRLGYEPYVEEPGGCWYVKRQEHGFTRWHSWRDGIIPSSVEDLDTECRIIEVES